MILGSLRDILLLTRYFRFPHFSNEVMSKWILEGDLEGVALIMNYFEQRVKFNADLLRKVGYLSKIRYRKLIDMRLTNSLEVNKHE